MDRNFVAHELREIASAMEREGGFQPGDQVKVGPGSGTLSGAEGVVIPWSEVSFDGRGIPKIPGHYSPVDRAKEVAVRFEDGEVGTMFKDRLKKVAAAGSLEDVVNAIMEDFINDEPERVKEALSSLPPLKAAVVAVKVMQDLDYAWGPQTAAGGRAFAKMLKKLV